MKKIDLEIKKYNDNLPFYKFKSKIKNNNDCFLAGESVLTNKPILIKKSNHNISFGGIAEKQKEIFIFGDKNRTINYYKNYILSMIEEDEPFIFINNILSLDRDFLTEIKKHAIEFKYSHSILINDYFSFLADDFTERKKTYIFNLFLEKNNNELLEHIFLKEDKNMDVYEVLMTKIINSYNNYNDSYKKLYLIIGIYKDPQFIVNRELFSEIEPLIQVKDYLSRFDINLITYIENEYFITNDSVRHSIQRHSSVSIYFDTNNDMIDRLGMTNTFYQEKSNKVSKLKIKLQSNYLIHYPVIYEIN